MYICIYILIYICVFIHIQIYHSYQSILLIVLNHIQYVYIYVFIHIQIYHSYQSILLNVLNHIQYIYTYIYMCIHIMFIYMYIYIYRALGTTGATHETYPDYLVEFHLVNVGKIKKSQIGIYIYIYI
jgi:hypothetical protein